MPVEVDVSQLKGENREKMKDFLERKLGISLEVKGDRLIFPETIRSRTQARKACRWFIGSGDLKGDYRILSSEGGIVVKQIKK
jgi:hypothetical protein